MNPWFSILGMLLAIAAHAGLYFLFSLIPAFFVIVGCEQLLIYLVARFTAGSSFGETMRGWFIGMNASLNMIFGIFLFKMIFPAPVAVSVISCVSLINALAAISFLSKSNVFQAVAGWLVWLMPMSWLVTGLGLLFFLINLLLSLITGGQVNYLRVYSIKMDWMTGTLFMKGGLISNMNPIDTAFNMGNFSFIDKMSQKWHINHEAGHTLNLAAFGSLFHFMGAIDENIFRAGSKAFAEKIAESNNSSGSAVIPMWS